MGTQNKLATFDFYKKLPADLSESTQHGSFLSVIMFVFLAALLFVEVWDFSQVPYESAVAIDPGDLTDEMLRVNFNITMLDMPCEYATVDMTDMLGTRRANVTKHVEKWNLDEEGNRIGFHGRNVAQRGIRHDSDSLPSLDEMHKNGIHAPEVTNPEFRRFKEDKNQITVVAFIAPWCGWCQRLAPTYERFAEVMQTADETADVVNVIKVNCQSNKRACADEKIRAFPTIRAYNNGNELMPTFSGDRTVLRLEGWAREHVRLWKMSHKDPKKAVAMSNKKSKGPVKKQLEHPQCLIVGYLEIKRVPGSFHIEARSSHHSFDASSTNASHTVNHLSFGPPSKTIDRRLYKFPEEYRIRNPADGQTFVSEVTHASQHHFIQAVHTRYEMLSILRARIFYAYQMTFETALMRYVASEAPKAKFAYVINPIGAHVRRGGRKWYEFVTSLAAILGGTVTIFGVLNMVVQSLFKSAVVG
eukprot:CAMPEP_0118851804 /NCGR_PEP_ID=MMETSP1163-20130328/1085_1 /TAXON_ID=124430 /ORGANISM="Phaeomonas parva, Strain CCMP2877" /LENGTH=472 /DNA_ID=CAMNT_0006784193 /DNA_START=199 /DNA_END=1617 /DNA_ORIENTATION=+